MNPKNAIEFKNVCKSFKVTMNDPEGKKTLTGKIRTVTTRHTVFDNLTFHVKKGEILGIIGRNGAGKSTLLSLAAMILEPDSGTIETSGRVVSILELSMGLEKEMTGRENIYLKSQMYGKSKKEVDAIVDKIIDYSGIRPYIDNPIKTYSSGMVSRLTFSIMVFTDIGILIADEVLTTGDAAFSAKAGDTFKKFLKDGKTVLFVSHSLDAIEKMCTRVIWIDGGKIIKDGKPKHVCAEYQRTMAESFEIIKDLAESGDPENQYKYALMFRDGRFVEQDFDTYLEWLRRSAENGYTLAQVLYADLLFDSGSENERATAITYYQSASVKGNTSARIKLTALTGGEDYITNRKELIDIFRQLAELGNPIDKNRYASLLISTAWSDSDREESFKWYLAAAEDGNPNSMMQVANMYRQGIGVKKDNDQYVKWMSAAAELGFQKAMATLADIYMDGQYVDRDQTKALQIYVKLAEQGQPRYQYKVASMYQDGIGTDVNLEEANRWFSTYSKSILAPYQLQALSSINPAEIKTDATPISLALKALESYSTPASLKMASFYAEGIFIEKNVDKAIKIYEKYSEIFGKPVLNVADMLYRGRLFEKNLDKSGEMYLKNFFTGDPKILFRIYTIYKSGASSISKDIALQSLYYAKLRGYPSAVKEYNSLFPSDAVLGESNWSPEVDATIDEDDSNH